jgi:signal transduction histidine kinase
MNNTLSINCDPHIFEKFLAPLAKLGSPVVFSEDGISHFSRNSILVLVINREVTINLKSLKSFHKVFLIIKDGVQNNLKLNNEVLIKSHLLRYKSCPSECFGLVIGQVMAEVRTCREYQNYLLKSIEASLSHQINNPLSIALGFNQRIKKKDIENTFQQEVEEIENSLKRINETIKIKLPNFLNNFNTKSIGKYTYFD